MSDDFQHRSDHRNRTSTALVGPTKAGDCRGNACAWCECFGCRPTSWGWRQFSVSLAAVDERRGRRGCGGRRDGGRRSSRSLRHKYVNSSACLARRPWRWKSCARPLSGRGQKNRSCTLPRRYGAIPDERRGQNAGRVALEPVRADTGGQPIARRLSQTGRRGLVGTDPMNGRLTAIAGSRPWRAES